MTVIVAWATGGVVLSVAAPRVIWTLIRRGTDPYVVLATWVAAVAGTLIAVAVPVALTVWPAHAGASRRCGSHLLGVLA